MEIWAFAHKYNIGQMEQAVSETIISHFHELDFSDITDVIGFYNTVPKESHALQDAIFQILLHIQASAGITIMEHTIKIAPRHVNAILKATRDNARLMLDTSVCGTTGDVSYDLHIPRWLRT